MTYLLTKLRPFLAFFCLFCMTHFSNTCSATESAPANSEQFEEAEEEPLTIKLVAEDASIQPGRPFWLAIRVDTKPGWHTYWKNPGMTGMACDLQWQLPEGLEVKSVLWPTPKRHFEETLYYFGYEGPFTVLAEIMPSKELQETKALPIGITMSHVACDAKTCLPGENHSQISLSVSAKLPEKVKSEAESFALARAALPREDWQVRAFHASQDLIALTLVPPESLEGVQNLSGDFFPESEEVGIESGHKSIEQQQTGELKLVFPYDASKLKQTPKSLEGVLVLADPQNMAQQKAAIAIHVPIEQYMPELQSEHAAPLTPATFMLALFFAFLGGMLLNCMPCVLPVLSVKLMQLMKMAGESRRILVQHALAYTMGIVISFWILAGALLALQAYGQSVGWGFQLQQPLFVALLALALVIFSLNLFGVFEWGTLFAAWAGNSWAGATSFQKQTGLFGAFCSGVLATAVATPCTGPFLGSAVGLAVTLTPTLSLAIFTAIALGMSLPYTLLTISPKLMQYLPRPGAWMVRFKEGMGFLLLATVLWLIYVFAFQTSLFATLVLLTAFLLAAFAAWIYGNWSVPSKTFMTRIVAGTFSTLLIGLSIYMVVKEVKQSGAPAEQMAAESTWLPFSPEAVEEAVKLGKPVFVDFTASWCLICQANHYVLESERVRTTLDQHGVVRFKADWSLSNPVITKALREHGRSGVPLYLLYAPYADKPIILPQLLTPENVISTLDTMYQDTPEKS